jgi:hypothetical protein
VGIALLPWGRLPAYVFGPLFLALNLWLLIADEHRTIGHVLLEIGCSVFAVWVIWSRYTTGEEPLWSEEQRKKARERQESNE